MRLPFLLVSLVLCMGMVRAEDLQIEGLHVTTFGRAEDPPLVFLHGGPGYNAVSFELTAARTLADSGFFVVSYDQRGCGRSKSEQDRTVYTYERSTSDLEAIVDHLALKDPLLVGHSHGGAIALRFDERFPGVAQAIVLVGAPVRYRETFEQLQRRCLRVYTASDHPAAPASRAALIDLHWSMFVDPAREASTFSGAEIGSTFQHAMACGVYSTKNPSEDERKLTAEVVNQAHARFLSDSRYEPVLGFVENESYGTSNLLPLVVARPGRVFAIYGEEDGLFDELELEVVRRAVGAERFHGIPRASHAVFWHQRSAFVAAVNSVAETLAAGAPARNAEGPPEKRSE